MLKMRLNVDRCIHLNSTMDQCDWTPSTQIQSQNFVIHLNQYDFFSGLMLTKVTSSLLFTFTKQMKSTSRVH